MGERWYRVEMRAKQCKMFQLFCKGFPVGLFKMCILVLQEFNLHLKNIYNI